MLSVLCRLTIVHGHVLIMQIHQPSTCRREYDVIHV